MAVRELNHPLLTRYRKALILGALREDVWYIAIPGVTWEHLSITHFYKTGAGRAVERQFYKAVREYRAGRIASAFVQLGRGNHVLADMLCPVHAQRIIHETDPFEWYVESHMRELRLLPLPGIEDCVRPSNLVDCLANYARQVPADATNSWYRRVLHRLGLRAKPEARLIRDHARRLVPMGAAYTAAHLRMFLRTTEAL
jgi:hypothetical protein